MTKAKCLTKREFRRTNIAGSFFVEPHGDGDFSFWYRCPCGCGLQGPLLVGRERKPDISPSWTWNGSTDKPTLQPSVNHEGHWHGWLIDGEWKVC